MPNGRRLRGVTGEQAVRAFERAGITVDRVRGSHYILRTATGRAFPVPMQGTLKIGTLLNAIRLSGLTVEEFEALL